MKFPAVGVAMMVHKGEQVLMVKRINSHGAGTWSTPGGHLEYGETFEQCAERETLEETGIIVCNVRYRAITNDVFTEEGKHYITIWMEADYSDGEPTPQEDECAEAGWFDLLALPEPLFLPLANLLSGQNRYP